jgi:hypothetical protein
MRKITEGLRKVRAKLARTVTGLDRAEARMRHHKKLWHQFDLALEQAIREHRPQARVSMLTDRREHEKAETHKWQKRQTRWARKHKYLQLVWDRRQRAKAKWLDEHPQDKYPDHGLVDMDGHKVAAWIAAHLMEARRLGYWHGYVISGWRSKSYSRSLCEAMCGAPSCPGRCAGEATNHVGIEEPEGAVDLSDPEGFQRYCRDHGYPLHGNGEILPADRPHFSRLGN